MFSPKITNDARPCFCLGTIRLVLTYNMLFLRSTFTKGGARYGQLIFCLSFHLAVYAQMEFYFWFDTINVGAQWLSGRVLDSRPKGRGFLSLTGVTALWSLSMTHLS